jgi:pimeloyl-ACP methyl ester carboxylesterase
MIVSTEDRYLPTEHGEVFSRRWRTDHSRKTPIVLMHDSLGCVELWRDFPERLAAATERDVIAYDRLGFGRSAPHPGGWSNSFIRDEAERFFPPVWHALDIEHFIALGHSVGGIMAASLAAHHPRNCRALITIAALVFVEDRTLQGIRQTQAAFAEPDQLERLRKYHGDKAEWILWAWIDTWLSDTTPTGKSRTAHRASPARYWRSWSGRRIRFGGASPARRCAGKWRCAEATARGLPARSASGAAGGGY